jgi:hypothetical protein
MKTEAQVDALMAEIPAEWRVRWCGGENGPCACLGCVQTGNKAVIARKITGGRFMGDPERISESGLKRHATIYAENKISRAEWDAWIARQTK